MNKIIKQFQMRIRYKLQIQLLHKSKTNKIKNYNKHSKLMIKLRLKNKLFKKLKIKLKIFLNLIKVK